MLVLAYWLDGPEFVFGLCIRQLKTVVQQRYLSKPVLGDLDPQFMYNIYRSAS